MPYILWVSTELLTRLFLLADFCIQTGVCLNYPCWAHQIATSSVAWQLPSLFVSNTMKCIWNTAISYHVVISNSWKIQKKPLRWQYLMHYNMYVDIISTWVGKKENPAYETTDFMTSVYTYFGQYIHFYSLWRQRLLCDVHTITVVKQYCCIIYS